MRNPGYYWCKCDNRSSHPEVMRWTKDGYWIFEGRSLLDIDGKVEVLSEKLEPPLVSIKPHPILILQPDLDETTKGCHRHPEGRNVEDNRDPICDDCPD